MKRIFLAAFIAASFFSCQDDDDNNITIAQCQQPSELRTFDITHTSALLKWQNPNNSTNVTVEYGIAGFEVGTGTTIDISGDSAIIDNLNVVGGAQGILNFISSGTIANSTFSGTNAAGMTLAIGTVVLDNVVVTNTGGNGVVFNFGSLSANNVVVSDAGSNSFNLTSGALSGTNNTSINPGAAHCNDAGGNGGSFDLNAGTCP